MIRQEVEQEKVLEELAQAKRNGDKQGMAAAHVQLGHLHKRAGQLEQAQAAYQRACVLAEELGNVQLEADACSGWGLLWEVQGDLGRAWQLLMASYEINKTSEDPGALGGQLQQSGFLGANAR